MHLYTNTTYLSSQPLEAAHYFAHVLHVLVSHGPFLLDMNTSWIFTDNIGILMDDVGKNSNLPKR